MNIKEGITNNHFLAISIGVIYLWFGALKFFAGISPAEELAVNTIDVLTFSLIPSQISIILLAIWETAVGLLFVLGIYKRTVISLALIHMVLTFTPLFFFPEQIFTSLPFQLTLLGQYILKNVIIIGALITLYKLTKSQKSSS